MASRVLLCLSPAGATAAKWAGGLADATDFGAGDIGLAAFDEWVARFAGTPAVVMVDSAEEDYRFETLPHTSGRDRKELLARKLKQLFRSTPFTAARIVAEGGARAGGRRQDLAMFCALTGAEAIAPWLRILRERGLPLAALYTLSTVTPVVARLLKLDAPNLLLVARHRAGLRQTFLRNGAFRLTRFTPLQATGDWGLEASLASEVRNTRLYLDSQAITTADETVQVVILDHDDSLVLLRDRIQDMGGNLRCQHLPRADLAKQLGLHATALDASPDALHLRLLGGKVTAPNLAPPDMVSGYRTYRKRRLLFATSGLVAATAAMWFGVGINRVATLDDQTDEAARQAARLQGLYEQLTREFPAAPASATVMQKTVDLAQRLRAAGPSPEPSLMALSRALEAVPSISLQSISWRHGKPAEVSAGLGSTAAMSAGGGALVSAALVSGEIAPFDGNYREAVDTLRLFAERLRANPAVAEVRVVKYPLDDSSKQVLSGSTGARAERTAPASFEIFMRMRLAGGGM